MGEVWGRGDKRGKNQVFIFIPPTPPQGERGLPDENEFIALDQKKKPAGLRGLK